MCPSARRLSLGVFLFLSSAALGGCSDTTWRSDSTSTAEVDGRDYRVSWIRIPPGLYDLTVEPADGDTATARADQAKAAAKAVLARHCLFDGAFATQPAITWPDGRYSFRYSCGRPSED